MSEPIWLRSAALSASLAGLDANVAVRGFDDAEGRAIDARMQVLANVARSVGWSRTAAEERDAMSRERSDDDESTRARIGAAVLASWLRGLSPAERNQWVRAFDAETLRLARDAAAANAHRAVDAKILSSIVARAAELLGRAPTAVELGALVLALHGDDRSIPSSLVALVRTARIVGLAWREGTRAFVASEVTA